ncbi:MAG: nuclear transport factor 2 family protein [Candidatus Sericytochromatia bacterium]
MGNVDKVKAVYAAFGEGQIPTILEHLAEDVNWEQLSTLPEVPWLKPRKGRSEVPGFFESLAPVTFHTFVPHTFFENGNQVLALVDFDATFPASDKKYNFRNEGHLWTFNDAGQVTDYEHLSDTHKHWQAYKGE